MSEQVLHTNKQRAVRASDCELAVHAEEEGQWWRNKLWESRCSNGIGALRRRDFPL